MSAAGARGVSFSSVPVAGTPDTIQVGGKTITEPPPSRPGRCS